jgi:cell wall-associated NlpC family hydrolase
MIVREAKRTKYTNSTDRSPAPKKATPGNKSRQVYILPEIAYISSVFQSGSAMQKKDFRAAKNVKFIFSIILLQAALSNQCYAAEIHASEPSTALIKLQELRERASDLTVKAMDLLGIRYKRGGSTPENGLDCSGFVRYVFKDAVGAELPRTSHEISKVGENIQTKDLQPGDLVFYNTLRRGFSHVGIYLGDNKFIHAPSAGGQIRIESMEIGYWKKRFNGARRINEEQKITTGTQATVN